MHAENRYAPAKSRTVSLGAAFLINGAIIAGLIISARITVVKDPFHPFTLIDISDPPVPPPLDPPKPQPSTSAKTRTTPPISVPKPAIESRTDNPMTGTDVILPPQPPRIPPGPTGAAVDMPQPADPILPPLIGAAQDPSFARDFQPPYPSSELRAQRDGVVRVRVLIGIDGRVRQIEQLSATSAAFFEATKRQALGRWRFKPATRGGIPQESWKVMSVRFELENQ